MALTMTWLQSQSLSWQLTNFQNNYRPPFRAFGLLYLYAVAFGIFACCTAVEATIAQDAVRWIYPQGGETFYYLDTVNVEYQSSLIDPWIFLLCYKDETVNSNNQSLSYPFVSSPPYIHPRFYPLDSEAGRADIKCLTDSPSATSRVLLRFRTDPHELHHLNVLLVQLACQCHRHFWDR